MVIWGAFWGAVLGLMWPGHFDELRLVGALLLGALAGWSLQRAVRAELRLAAVAASAAGIVAPAVVPAPLRPADFQDTAPQVVPPAAVAPRPAPVARPAPVPGPRAPGLAALLFERARGWLFGGNTVVRMGVLVLFIGLAFLAKYAVEHSLLPPELRLAAIAAAGIGLFVAGLRLRRQGGERLAYALTLQGAGVAVLYLTWFAAFRLYQFLPAGAAFAALGLVCAFSAAIALAQNAQAMAFIGFAGGFAAPLLVSTGQGDHVALFGYYTLLSVAIAAVAWFRAWRALNLLGFFATFGVATLWGVLKYQPQDLASTEPFLIGFFAIYLAASLLYALRHSHAPGQAVDATLVFGVPIAALGLQAALMRESAYATAFSSLALGALYLALGTGLARRDRGAAGVAHWLAQCHAALGLGFVTLAVPLALDAHWSSAVWAVEGAAVYWMGGRQGRWLARAAGLALQGLAAVMYLGGLAAAAPDTLPVANARFVGGAMLAGAALAIAWWSRAPRARGDGPALAAGFASFELGLSPALFWIGFLWWQFALANEIDRSWLGPDGTHLPMFAKAAQVHLKMLAWVGSAFALHFLALPARRSPWPVAASPACTVLPAMGFAALSGMAVADHVFQSGGWAAWPLAAVMHVAMLRRLDAGAPQPWWRWVHAGGVWLAVVLDGNLLVFAIGRAQLWQTAWATVMLLVAGTGVLLVLARKRAFAAIGQPRRWPLDRFAAAYLWRAAAPLALLLALGALAVAVHSSGNARPLPYVPLLNPTDLAVGLALAACTSWLLRVRASALPLPAWMRGKLPVAGLAAVAFVAINTVWLRVAHHHAGVPWDAGALFDSFLVQAGYSILWTMLALGLMVGGHRRGLRPPWMVGAALLGLTVLKLFAVDLSNRDGSERIFVFIAVGLLMLVVGYFAPLPPNAAREAALGEAHP
jgi:uncharacterized membrane protein